MRHRASYVIRRDEEARALRVEVGGTGSASSGKTTPSRIAALCFLVAACGSSASAERDATDAGSGPAPAPTTPMSSGGPPAEGGAGAARGKAELRVTNTTGRPLTIYVNQSGQFPLWLSIGEPELPIGVLGLRFCDDGTHNDPSPVGRTIEHGAAATYTWDGTYWEAVEGCWARRTVSPGSYPGEACAYEGPAREGDAGTPLCVAFSVEMPASGTKAIEARW